MNTIFFKIDIFFSFHKNEKETDKTKLTIIFLLECVQMEFHAWLKNMLLYKKLTKKKNNGCLIYRMVNELNAEISHPYKMDKW